MLTKYFYCFFIVFIVLQKYDVSCGVIGGKTDTSPSESSEMSDFAGDFINTLSQPRELTDDDIEKLKKEFEKELTPTQSNELTRILQKFKKNTTQKDHLEGMVELLVLAVGVKSNATDAEIRTVLGQQIQTTTLDTITTNTIQNA